jgi:pimeloyl-ACP methyl ester carboxylesterase
MSTRTSINKIDVDGVDLFYREAGPKQAPHVLLLHGFPSSSHQYRNLIPILAQKYHVVAPDIPGFGFTDVPAERQYKYTFESFAKTIGAFLDALKIKKFAVYIFDYGAPTGLRLALTRPDLTITGIISQNGNAYEEGLGEFWEPLKRLWKNDTKENRDALRPFFTIEATKSQYFGGVSESHVDQIQPEAYYLDQALLDRPGNNEIQLDIFYDYRTNIELYPQFQKYIREKKVPVLAAWGKNDGIFIAPGAEAFKRDNPDNTVLKLYDTGHFALETHLEEISRDIISFLDSHAVRE